MAEKACSARRSRATWQSCCSKLQVECVVANRARCDYYYNNETGEVQWDKPSELMTKEEKQGSKEEKDNMPIWLEIWDSSSSAYYYYNQNTGASQWEKPESFARLSASDTDSMLKPELRAAMLVQKIVRKKIARRKMRNKRGKRMAENNSSCTWIAIMDPQSGYEYYYNVKTGYSQWEKPRELTEEYKAEIRSRLEKRCKKYSAAESTVDACAQRITQLETLFNSFADEHNNEAFRRSAKDASLVFKQTKRSIKEARTQIEAAALFIERAGGNDTDDGSLQEAGLSARACKAQLFTCVRGLLNIYRRCLDDISSSKVHIIASEDAESDVRKEFESEVAFDAVLNAVDTANAGISVAMQSLGAASDSGGKGVSNALFRGARSHKIS